MSEPIKVGDLVMIVRVCCAKRDALGAIFSVAGIDSYRTGAWQCRHCMTTGRDCRVKATAKYGDGNMHAPLSWLKRIPPLSELEGEKRDEEITA